MSPYFRVLSIFSIVYALIVFPTTTNAFLQARCALRNTNRPSLSMNGDLDDTTRSRIANLVNTNKVFLFMKGNKLFPQCGFSNTACRILDALGANYETFNVLEDDNMRAGIKVCNKLIFICSLWIIVLD